MKLGAIGRLPTVASDKETITEIKGMRKLLRILNSIPKDLQDDVRDASVAIADDLVAGAKSAAHTPMAQLVVGGLKVKRDRVPVVRVGRNVITARGARETDIFYGAEFGGRMRRTTMQFQPHRGREGYFLYPTARQRGKHYAELWAESVDKAFKAWNDRSAL